MIRTMTEAQNIPTDKSLIKLEKLYNVGDYKQAKSLANSLLESHQLTDEEKARIQKVLAATRTDPAAIIAFALTFGLMMYLFIKYGT